MTNQDKINSLSDKLNMLLARQNDFLKEIKNLREELNSLKLENSEQIIEKEIVKPSIKESMPPEVKPEQELAFTAEQPPELPKEKVAEKVSHSVVSKPKTKSNWEKFIGENLINKIGISILIIGVAIGAKYAIDNDLISPLTRIILGYFVGAGLLGFAIKLKPKYENFSAVLLSGAMAIIYFITFLAYSLYGLIPQLVAFALMVVFTIFTVISAINYNRQIIAHIGLVGAYAVPFLLSNNSGNAIALFSYIAIINVGILAISIKKYWKPLFYVAFGLTWLIYFAWYQTKYEVEQYFSIALVFLLVYFVIFYITFVVYKFLKKEKMDVLETSLLPFNSFIFFGLGYLLLNDHETGQEFLGLFTLFNAIIHFVVGLLIYKQQLVDKNLLYLIIGMVLLFITIAVPIQLDGNWVTLFWIAEAVLLFWLGKKQQISVYKVLSIPLMVLAFFSLCHDWFELYDNKDTNPLFNSAFLTSILFMVGFSVIYFINKKYTTKEVSVQKTNIDKIATILASILLIVTAYWAFRLEISNYFGQLLEKSLVKLNDYDWYKNYDYNRFKSLTIINYSLLFFSLLALLNTKKIKNKLLGIFSIVFIGISVLTFLTQGLLDTSYLQDSYLNNGNDEYYNRTVLNIIVRYISYGFIVFDFYVVYQHVKTYKTDYKKMKIIFDLALNITVLWIVSSELVSWMNAVNSEQSYKLGLSILWGIYSLGLISFGIWKKQKHLRIFAIVLFGITLVKLFLYDISHLDTIAKTIVFVSLGILLLIISFLYNKYKNIISDEEDI